MAVGLLAGPKGLTGLQHHLFRELGSIVRSDLVICVSDVEAKMLTEASRSS